MGTTEIVFGLVGLAVLALVAYMIWSSAWNQSRLLQVELLASEQTEAAGDLATALRHALAAEDLWSMTNAPSDRGGMVAHVELLETVVRRIESLSGRTGPSVVIVTQPLLKSAGRYREFLAQDIGLGLDYRGRTTITAGDQQFLELLTELLRQRLQMRKELVRE